MRVAPSSPPVGAVAGRRLVVLAALVGSGWALYDAGVGRRPVANPAGWAQVSRFLVAAAHPETAPDFLRLVWDATLVTAAYALLGTALALVIGLLAGFAVSQTFWRGERASARGSGGWAVVRVALALPRGLHEAVWALLLVNVLGLNPLVAVLAIGVPSGAMTAKVFADLLDEAPRAPYLALLGAGAGRGRALLFGLLPLAGPDLLSYAFYRLECAMRTAVVLGIVGAGGLGFQLELSFSALRYGEMWTVLDALVLLCALADLLSTTVRRRLRSPRPPVRGSRTGRPGPARDRPVAMAVLAALALTGWAAVFLRVRPSSLWSGRAGEQLAVLTAQAWPPRHDPALLGQLWRLSVQTFQMSLLAALLATAAGVAVSQLAARPVSAAGGDRPATRLLARALLLLCRAVPPPVWALMVLFVLYPGLLPGALALAAYNVGILGRLMAEGQDGLDPAPAAALQAQGASPAAVWLYAVLPRTTPKNLAYGLYRWEVAARETVVVGLVGAGGLGQLLARQTAGFDWSGVLATLLALVALTLVVDLLTSAARRAWR